VIATEARPGPLARARASLAGSGVEVRAGDGLGPLAPGEVDAVVIAGLGGRRIASILAAAPEAVASLRLLVLQPVQHGEQLRDWLAAGHARLEERWAVQGRRSYRVLLVRPRLETG
jgi:tRNA (adenine22-N1)-methyltransferase